MLESNVFMTGEAVEECTDEDEVLLVCLFLCFLLTFGVFLTFAVYLFVIATTKMRSF